jgi:hypothetical protein
MKYDGVYVICVQRFWNNNIDAIKRLYLTLHKPIVVSKIPTDNIVRLSSLKIK